MEQRPVSTLARVILYLGLVVGAGAVLAGPGAQLGWWDYRLGLSLLALCAVMGLVVAVTGLLAVYLARPNGPRAGFGKALVGTAIAAVTFALPGYWAWQARDVPPIHDITTDLDAPPAFEAAAEARRAAPNAVEYPGAEFRQMQREAYPEIVPLQVSAAPDQVLATARELAEDRGWEVLAVDTAHYRLEAVAHTFWFGFQDDVVVRIAENDKVQVDMRSASRVGRSDVGTNAARIQAFLEDLEQRL